MTSCAVTKTNSTTNSVACPLIPKDGVYATFGDVWQRLDELTDMYTECRKRHDALIDYMNRSK